MKDFQIDIFGLIFFHFLDIVISLLNLRVSIYFALFKRIFGDHNFLY